MNLKRMTDEKFERLQAIRADYEQKRKDATEAHRTKQAELRAEVAGETIQDIDPGVGRDRFIGKFNAAFDAHKATLRELFADFQRRVAAENANN